MIVTAGINNCAHQSIDAGYQAQSGPRLQVFVHAQLRFKEACKRKAMKVSSGIPGQALYASCIMTEGRHETLLSLCLTDQKS